MQSRETVPHRQRAPEGRLEFGQFLAVGGGLSAAGEASRALGQGVAGGANTICPVGRRLL